MRYKTTGGSEYFKPDMCSCCQLDTAGVHKLDCPSYSDKGCTSNICKPTYNWKFTYENVPHLSAVKVEKNKGGD